MKVNAHKQTFFQSIHVLFSLALSENKSTTAHAQNIYSLFTCVILLHRVETALPVHTQTFFQSAPCIFLLHHMGKWKLSTIMHTLTFCS